jgi:hypothetical protein
LSQMRCWAKVPPIIPCTTSSDSSANSKAPQPQVRNMIAMPIPTGRIHSTAFSNAQLQSCSERCLAISLL